MKAGFLSATALAVGGGGILALQRGSMTYAPLRPLHVLNPRTFNVVVAAAECILSATKNIDYIHLAHKVDEALMFASPSAQRDFPRVLALFDNALTAFLSRGDTRAFSTLPEDARAKALNEWRDSSFSLLRGGYHAMRRLILGTHYAELENAQAIGYPGPPFEKPEAPPIQPRLPLSPPFPPAGTP